MPTRNIIPLYYITFKGQQVRSEHYIILKLIKNISKYFKLTQNISFIIIYNNI